MNKISKEIKPGIWVGLNTKVDWDNVKIEGPLLWVRAS